MAEMKGLEAVLARLKRIPVEVREAVAAAVEAEADAMVEAVKRHVPVGPTGRLRDSVRKEKGRRPLQWLVRAGGPKTTVKVRKGVDNASFARAKAKRNNTGEFDYSRAVEFGHLDGDGRFIPANPFFWPLYRARRKAIKRNIAAAARKRLKTLFPKV